MYVFMRNKKNMWIPTPICGYEKDVLKAHADSEDPDQPKYLCSLIRALAIHLQNHCTPLRKHAYSNKLKISPPKTVSFQIEKNLIFFIVCLC